MADSDKTFDGVNYHFKWLNCFKIKVLLNFRDRNTWY